MTNETIFVLMLLGLMVIVLVLAIVFRQKFKTWDSNMANKLKGFMQLPSEEHSIIGATYSVERCTADGHMLQKEMFSCNGRDLEESLNGISWLKMLADGELDKRGKKKDVSKPNQNYFG